MFDISIDSKKLYFYKKWHLNLKENKYDSKLVAQNSYRFTTLLVLNCLLACFLVNSNVLHEKIHRYLFIQSVLTILIGLINYYPTYTLTISGYIHLRILKWIVITLGLGSLVFLLHSQPHIFSSFLFCVVFSIKLFHNAPFVFPNTFTFTELVICVNLITNGLFVYMMHLFKILAPSGEDVTVIEQAIMWFVILLIFTRKIEIARQSFIVFILLSIFILLTFFIPILIILIDENAFVWLYNYIFNNDTRIFLIIYWLFLFTSISFVIVLQKSLMMANLLTTSSLSSSRKLFHIIICCVYIPGLLYDVEFLTLCSFGMLILLLLVELIRYYEIGRLSEIIEDLMDLFVDTKDFDGRLILSHIYLLVGLSLPLWLSNFRGFHVSQCGGIATIGIADTFASIFGSFCGYHKWPGNHKTVEGTLAFMISQAIFYYLLQLSGFVDLVASPFYLIYIIISIFLSAIVETFSKDNDNLILSIVVYPFLVMIR